MKRVVLCILIAHALAVAVGQTEAVDIPYAIDRKEVRGGVTIGTSAERTRVSSRGGSPTVLGYLVDAPRMVVLLDARGQIVATDLVVAGLKEEIFFNAWNTALSDVIISMTFWRLPDASMVEAYQRIDDHPRFPELVQLFRASKGIADTDEEAALSVEIATDIATELIEEARRSQPQ